MKQSLTYYITLFFIRLIGIKKKFSKDPINFREIRKEDIYHPTDKFFKQYLIRTFKVSDSVITEIGTNTNSNKLLIFIHGGAFISGPVQHHWEAIKQISKKTEYKIWMCNYPKAPEHKIGQISANIDLVYSKAIQYFRPNKISFIGDSAGGTLVMCLIQRLIKDKKELPQKIILISPVMDASMTNPDTVQIDKSDPMLSRIGVLSAKKMTVENDNLKSEMISPLYGSFEHFPQTILFLAENDITYPDQKLAVKKLIEANINHIVIIGKNMPHIWPLLPVMKEAKNALYEIIKLLNN